MLAYTANNALQAYSAVVAYAIGSVGSIVRWGGLLAMRKDALTGLDGGYWQSAQLLCRRRIAPRIAPLPFTAGIAAIGNAAVPLPNGAPLAKRQQQPSLLARASQNRHDRSCPAIKAISFLQAPRTLPAGNALACRQPALDNLQSAVDKRANAPGTSPAGFPLTYRATQPRRDSVCAAPLTRIRAVLNFQKSVFLNYAGGFVKS